MHSALHRKIDQFNSFRNTGERAFQHYFRRTGEGDHTAVVVSIPLTSEQSQTIHGPYGGGNGVHDRGVAAFGKIRHALD
jgi:hypothetical protein